MKARSTSHSSTFRWLLQITGRRQWLIWGLLLLQLLLAAQALTQTWLLKQLVDVAVGKNRESFWHYALLLVLILLVLLGLQAALRYLREYTHASIENALKKRLFGDLLTRSFSEISATHSGEWMNRLTNDTVVVATGFSDIVPDVLGMLLRLIGAIIMILYMIPRVAWVMIPAGLLLVFFTFLFRKKLKQMHKNVQEADGRLRIFMTERLTSMLVLRSFGQEENTLEEGTELMEAHKAVRMKRSNFSNLCNFGFGLFMRGAYTAAAIYCAVGILNGTLSYGTFVATLQLVNQVQAPFANISGYLPRYYAMLASAERLREAEFFAKDCEGEKLSAEEITRAYSGELDSLQLKDVSFRYPPREGEAESRLMTDLNLRIGKGEIVAVTGPSGCGKSTLLKLLMALYPLDAGSREVALRVADGSLRTEPLSAAWRGLFAYVPQGNQLMSGSIREVVSFGDKDAPDDAVRQALEAACAADFVEELPSGADTKIGERGAGLSEGQLQRLAIARAIYSGHPVLLLDEATSSLDEETERRLLEKLRNVTDRTVVIVTHRMKVLEICSREIRMEEE